MLGNVSGFMVEHLLLERELGFWDENVRGVYFHYYSYIDVGSFSMDLKCRLLLELHWFTVHCSDFVYWA